MTSLFLNGRRIPVIKKTFSFLLVFLILLGLTQPALAISTINSDPYQYHSLYFDQMDIDMEVDETGLIKINTKIDAVFNRPMRGLEIFIPQRYVMDFKDPDTNENVRKRYVWKVEELQNKSNFKMTVETVDNSAIRLRFGDEYTYIDGPQTYEYSYQIQMHDLNYRDIQMLYWNIVGDGFDVTIDKLNFEVRLPKTVDEYPVYIYSGMYNSRNNDFIEFEFVDNQVIKGHSIQPLLANVGVTAELMLPKGYFNFPIIPDFSPLFLGALGLGALLSLYWFFRYGKDDPMVITIEHEPPKGLSSAMVGYIFDNTADTKDILSLIVEWASYGYLDIEEVSKKNMRLTKLRELPESTVPYEKRLFNNLFNNRDEVETKQLEQKFYRHVNTAQAELQRYFKSSDRKIFNSVSTRRQFLAFFLAAALFAAFVGYQVYRNTFFWEIAIGTLGMSFAANIAFSILQLFFFNDFTRQSRAKQFADIIFSLITTAVFFLSYYFVLNYFEVFDMKFVIALFAFFIIVIAAINMSKRTPYGNQNLGKILGLRRFIEEAEKDRLEYLVNDNPQYFYKVLPYAYVLGVSDIWSKKFEDIAIPPPPGMSHNPNFSPIWYNNRLNNMMYRTTRSMTSTPPSTRSSGGFGGGSFGGGGFSGGGGGFSGGGFGGGGGGGW